MGEKNNAMCSYLAVPENFADFINGTLFDGRSQIEEEDVLSYDGVYHEKVKDGKGEKLKLERTRDVIKRIAKGNRYAVVGVENQYKVHYAMPFRCMEYEVAEYIKQLKEIRKNFQRKEATGEEFLSKMSSDDKLNPVVVVMFYHGSGEYEGSKDLHSMLDFTGENAIYKEFVTNYQMNLITLDDIKEENFKTGLKQLIGVMKRSKDKVALQKYMEENSEEFSHMDEETFDTISVMVNQKDLVKYKNSGEDEEGSVNMCRAIEDIRKEGRNEGIEEGMHAFIALCKDFSISKEDTISKLREKFSISKKKAKEYTDRYWQ